MIDLHCHILPGLDDGAQSMEEALEMARDGCSGRYDRHRGHSTYI